MAIRSGASTTFRDPPFRRDVISDFARRTEDGPPYPFRLLREDGIASAKDRVVLDYLLSARRLRYRPKYSSTILSAEKRS